MYAWSRILYGAEKDDDGNVLGPLAIEVNEEVDQDTIGASDEEWQDYVNGGVVREVKMPEALQSATESPRQLMQAKLTEAQEGFNMSGPTDDLLRRFDDEGTVLPAEEIDSEGKVTPAPAPASGLPNNNDDDN